MGCCYEITPSAFPAALIQTPAATDTSESAISTVESPKLRLCRASVSGNHQFPKPAVSTHTPREICPSKFHNNSPIPHTHVRFASLFFSASSFLRGSSNSSSQHFLIRRGTSLLIHFQFAAATLQQLGQKKVRKKPKAKISVREPILRLSFLFAATSATTASFNSDVQRALVVDAVVVC